MTTQSINLNVIPGGVLPRVNVSQYDTGLEQIVATLYEGSSAFEMPSSATVYVQGTKKDGTGFQYTCSYSNNVITIDLTEQMTVFAGEVVTELVIFDSSNNRIATCNFIINVEQTALSDDTQISETDLPIIQTIPQSVSACEGYAETAHQWATYGSDSETPSSTNNSKYWAEQSQVYAQGALHWKGSIAFASIPTSNLTVGDLYNITNDFTTDSRFVEGSGKECAAGTNIVWSDSSKWDILTSATYASQVKYDNTDSGLSATNVQGAIKELTAPTFTQASTRANINSGETISTIMGKIKKFFADLKTVAFTGNASDVTYDNTTSGLESTDTQGSIDELNSDLTDMTIAEDVTSDFFSSTTGLDSGYSVYRIGNLFILNIASKTGLSSGWANLAQINTSKYNILMGFTGVGVNGTEVAHFSIVASTGIIRRYTADTVRIYNITACILANKIS